MLKPVRQAPALEGLILVILTIALSFGIFEVVRRVPLLRPLFGLARRPAAAPVGRAAGRGCGTDAKTPAGAGVKLRV